MSEAVYHVIDIPAEKCSTCGKRAKLYIRNHHNSICAYACSELCFRRWVRQAGGSYWNDGRLRA